jgi:preprotein translocase subunit SecA
MGLSVGIILSQMEPAERKAAYAADITYGTNNEFGFDYLRDNMVIYQDHMVQRGHAFAIVDEVDSILIDEARTPLIISGMGDESTKLYDLANQFASRLRCKKFKELDEKQAHDDIDADYIVDEKAKTCTLTASGIKKAEQFFQVDNLTDPDNSNILHHVNQAIRAHGIMTRDVDYVVRDGEVIIVDEFTGRLMIGRRYSDGLHQAIEAKERVKVERESKTLATITFQNYFRLYQKLAGMTGTAMTEEAEFKAIYGLDVIEIPTNLPMIRKDHSDLVFRTERGKLNAVINQIVECHQKGQPVLVGTVSIEKSEQISAILKKQGIPHTVLNAKHHEKEANIVASAGRKGAVTIATNMAGRGTDIRLGGNPEHMAKQQLAKEGVPDELLYEASSLTATDNEEILNARRRYKELYAEYKKQTDAEKEEVIAAGGLFIVGTERHESRRIDNQLRGRSGRQGDPGESRFFISLEDDLMRLFGSERISGMMENLGVDENTPIDAKMLTNAIESAQKRLESRNFQTRKHVLEYDDVMNLQRKIIYEQRSSVLTGSDISEDMQKILRSYIENTVAGIYGDSQTPDAMQVDMLKEKFMSLGIPEAGLSPILQNPENFAVEDATQTLLAAAEERYAAQEAAFGAEQMRELERVALLRAVDSRWMDHIDAMHELRQGIGLRAYGQTDPVQAYKKEGFDMFEEMIASIHEATVRFLLTARLQNQNTMVRKAVATPISTNVSDEDTPKKPVVRKSTKIGRNEPCPCGSGKKYKKCCGFNETISS